MTRNANSEYVFYSCLRKKKNQDDLETNSHMMNVYQKLTNE